MFEDVTAKLRSRLNELSAGKWQTAVRMVDIAMICPNPFHAPQKMEESELQELAQTFKTNGVRTPLTVLAVGTAQKPMFQLIAGERIYRACIYGKISPIPCVILDADPDRIIETGNVSYAINNPDSDAFSPCAIGKDELSEKDPTQKLGLTVELLRNRLSLLRFDIKERKLILKADLSTESILALENLPPRLRHEIYRSIEQGNSSKSIEEAIAKLSEESPKVKCCIKDTGFFFNSVDKAVKTMNESGIPVKCTREERKNYTKLTIFVPKQL